MLSGCEVVCCSFLTHQFSLGPRHSSFLPLFMLSLLPIRNKQSLQAPAHWAFPVCLDLMNVISVVPPFPKVFFSGELYIRLFIAIWVTNEVKTLKLCPLLANHFGIKGMNCLEKH